MRFGGGGGVDFFCDTIGERTSASGLCQRRPEQTALASRSRRSLVPVSIVMVRLRSRMYGTMCISEISIQV